ncbi:SCO family protein [Fodinibius salsisoli]|uniref:SCO family protein n=1 Tax=Fodinibius salsisoli TaxID=2820877 RepID=A0ABT3PMY8_9BACT|nr:SCO family protein [Fodinibius salsisoli]MCW9707300.1 SCO family protein [Fodinibius salsisoli]
MNIRPLVIAILAMAIMFGACSGNDGEREQQSKKQMAAGDHTAHAQMKMASEEPTDESIYNVSSIWLNRYGQKVKLGSLRGKVQVVAMVYTHCEFACPRILADMKRIRDRLSEEELKATNFVIVSIDPERDIPERLRNFASENELSDTNWTLLNGGQGDILELAALLGVKYKKISETDFTHSNIITVLNKEGEVAHQRKKLDDDPTPIVKNIKVLTS